MATASSELRKPRADTRHDRRIIIEDRASIPASVTDLKSFRRWALSDEYPDRGWFSWLQGDLWVDLSMEELFSHNQVKLAFDVTLGTLLQTVAIGRFVVDRMRLTHPGADVSTEPDGLFYSWQTVRSKRLRFVEGKRGGCVELEGSPDMVLEIISSSSTRKDTRILRQLYHEAGIPEYWLVDARGDEPAFDILRHAGKGYRKAESTDGWPRSRVFSRAFRLVKQLDPLGHPQYVLESQD